MICPYCGSNVKEGTDKCPYCNEWLDVEAQENNYKKEQKEMLIDFKDILPDLTGKEWYEVLTTLAMFTVRVTIVIIALVSVVCIMMISSMVIILIKVFFGLRRAEKGFFSFLGIIPDTIGWGVNFIKDI